MDEWGMSHELLDIACKPMKDLTRDDIRALKTEYQRLYGQPSPVRTSRTFLTGNVAWGLQAEAMGQDPSKLREKLLKRFKRIKQTKGRLQIGARLIREWHGTTYQVTVTRKGYEYNNQTYSSLTPIAQLITGSHVSGPRFFGISKSHDR